MNKIELSIGGKNYTAKLGLGFIQRVKESEGLDEHNPITNVPTIKLMYHAIAFAAERNGEVFMSFFDFLDILDELEAQPYADLNTVFQIAFFKSLNVKTVDKDSKKMIDGIISDLEKKMKPQKKTTAAK